ncbi:MAG: hypothetical protein HYR66_16885 [Sphingobacteriales bacterium]|nr:hypothetical protein [Sphingobacteriales bacterium]
MKTILTALFFLMAGSFVSAQSAKKDIHVVDTTKKVMIVEAACGKCKLCLKGTDCELAVRIKGKAYYVDGTSIDDHGDAHTNDGFCNAVRKAEVQGEIVNGRFKATYFKLLPDQPKKEKQKG